MNKILTFFALTFIAGLSLAADYQEGKDYDVITPAPPISAENGVAVTEFFMYTCPHCKTLEPALDTWLEKKPENVKFDRIPAMFGGAATLHAKTYYALEVMGEGERLHMPLFVAIHDERRRLGSQKDVEKFLAEQNVDIEKFRQALGSFTVQTKSNRAAALMRRYGIRSVPALVVDGRYRVKNSDQITKVTDYLVEKIGTDTASAK